MKKAIAVLEQLTDEGLLEAYAIGGGIGATFYMEPVLTYDLDVFVLLAPSEGLLLTLTPLYVFLAQMGYAPDREHIVVEGLPVQFIPAYSPLTEEAVRRAQAMPFAEFQVEVIRPEYLAAIMMDTGRPKDRARLSLFVDEVELDEKTLQDILRRHGLESRWRKWTSEDGP